MLKKVAILQSNYIPWKGYFDLISSVDEFILYDDMQYTRRDWRNRNRIKTPQGLKWLTVPVKAKGRYYQKIRDTQISGNSWANDHWNSLVHNYQRASYFNEISSWFVEIYKDLKHENLSTLNRTLIEKICEYLGIHTVIKNSWDYNLVEGKTERLAELCVQAGGTVYVSGPAAKEYIQENIFAERGISLEWFKYTGYREYPQLWGEFNHEVTILDLLFNCGKDAPKFMRFV